MRGKIVVVTGASGGLGREVAVQFARRGAAVALAARRHDALEVTAELCRRAGGEALVVDTDVTSEEQVRRLAQAALAEWGQIDIWVNNAGVTLFANLSEAPLDDLRRVVETNVFGAIFGVRAVLPVFRRQRRGVLINVGSILSKIGQPFVPAYVISKFALRGVSETLRVELADQPDIHVCTVLPYAVDTPHFESGANQIGRQPRAMPPMQSPEKVARAIVRLAERPRHERHVPRIAALGLALHALVPRTVELLLLRALREWHLGDGQQPRTRGNLYRPRRRHARVHGERPPKLSVPAFTAWTMRELVGVEAELLRHRMRRGFTRRREREAPQRRSWQPQAERA
jgi:NAD(P)-dependent dehydrogenase (short-subunit alcohol dehydrogenase family)